MANRLQSFIADGYRAARFELAPAAYWAEVMLRASLMEYEEGDAATRHAANKSADPNLPRRDRRFYEDVSAELRRRGRRPPVA